jgi:flavin reductase (DIM6/NTAB) family NADH-FMN oxidoreductase RutF
MPCRALLVRLLEEWAQAQVTDVVARGDHSVFVAEVREADIRDEDRQALVMWDTAWYYGG